MASAGVDNGVLLEDWASSPPCEHGDDVKPLAAAGEKKSSPSPTPPPVPVQPIREARIRRSGSCFGRHFFFDRRRKLTDLPRDISFRSCSSTACTSSSSSAAGLEDHEEDDRDEFRGEKMMLESSVDDSSLSESVTTSSEVGEEESDSQQPPPLLREVNLVPTRCEDTMGRRESSSSPSTVARSEAPDDDACGASLANKGTVGDYSASAFASSSDSDSLHPSCSSAADGEETDASSSSSFVGRDRMIEEHVVACGCQQRSANEREGSESEEESSGEAESKSNFEPNKSDLDSKESTMPESDPKLGPESRGERGYRRRARTSPVNAPPPRNDPGEGLLTLPPTTPPIATFDHDEYDSSSSSPSLTSSPPRSRREVAHPSSSLSPSFVCVASPPLKGGEVPGTCDHRGPSSLATSAGAGRCPVDDGRGTTGEPEEARTSSSPASSPRRSSEEAASSSHASSSPVRPHNPPVRPAPTGGAAPGTFEYAMLTTAGREDEDDSSSSSSSELEESLPSSFRGGMVADMIRSHEAVCEVDGLYPIPESIPAEEGVRVEMEQLDAGLYTHATTFQPIPCRRASSPMPEKADVADETRGGIAETSSSSSRDVDGTRDDVCKIGQYTHCHGARDVETVPNGRTTGRLLSSHTSDGRRKVAKETAASPSVATHEPIASSKAEVAPPDEHNGTCSSSTRSSPMLTISMMESSLLRDAPRSLRDVHNEAVGIGETVSTSCRGQYLATEGDGGADSMHDDVLILEDSPSPIVGAAYLAPSSPPPPAPNSNPLSPEVTTASMSTPTGDEGWAPGEGHRYRSRGVRCGHASIMGRAEGNDTERCVSPRVFGPASRYCSSSLKAEKNQSSTFTKASGPIHTSGQPHETPTSLPSFEDLKPSSVSLPSSLSRRQTNETKENRARFSVDRDTKQRRYRDNVTSDLMIPVEESRSTSPTLQLSASSSFGGLTLHVRNEDRQQPTHDYATNRCTESDVSSGTPDDRSLRARRSVQQSPLTPANCSPDESALDTDTVMAVTAKTAEESSSSLGRISRMKGPIHKMVTSAEAIATIEHIEAAPTNEFNHSHARKLSALKKFWARKQQEITLGHSAHDDHLFGDSTRRRDHRGNAAHLPFLSANEIVADSGTRNGAKAQISSSERPTGFLSRCNQESTASLPASHRKLVFHLPVDIALIPFMEDGRGDARPVPISQGSKLESQATRSSDVFRFHPGHSLSKDVHLSTVPGGTAPQSSEHRSRKTSHCLESSSYSLDSTVGGYSIRERTVSESESSIKHRQAIKSQEPTHGSIANRVTASLPQTTCHTITDRPCVPFSRKRVPSTTFGNARGNVKSQYDAQTDISLSKLNAASNSPSIIEDDWSCSATVSSQAISTLSSSQYCRKGSSQVSRLLNPFQKAM